MHCFFCCCEKSKDSTAPLSINTLSPSSSKLSSLSKSPAARSRFSLHGRPRVISTSLSRKKKAKDEKEPDTPPTPPSFSYTSWSTLTPLREANYPDFLEKINELDPTLLSTKWQEMLNFQQAREELEILRSPTPKTLSKFAEKLLTMALADIEYFRRQQLAQENTSTLGQQVSCLPEDPGFGGDEDTTYAQISAQFTVSVKEKREKKAEPGTLTFAKQNKNAILQHLRRNTGYAQTLKIFLNKLLNLYIDSILPGIISDMVSFKDRHQETIKTHQMSEKEEQSLISKLMNKLHPTDELNANPLIKLNLS